MSEEERIRDWYHRITPRQTWYRHSPYNPEVWFQNMAIELSVVAAVSRIAHRLDFQQALALDVGCGRGDSALRLVKLGFDPAKLTGIDILLEQIEDAKRLFPNITFICGDASDLRQFHSQSFDVVHELSMFFQIGDDDIAGRIAGEMLRVTKAGGFIILTDWRYSKPFNVDYKGLSKKRIDKLFEVGTRTKLLGRFKGELVPPVGRALSKWAPWAYFLVQTSLPFLVGQETVLLERKASGVETA